MFTRTAIVLALIFVSIATAAQDRKNEVGFLLGGTIIPSLSIRNQNADVGFGSGLTFQATYARHLAASKSTSLYFEVPFLSSPLVNAASSSVLVPKNYAFIFVTPGVRVKLRSKSAVSPWFSVGGDTPLFRSQPSVMTDPLIRVESPPTEPQPNSAAAWTFGRLSRSCFPSPSGPRFATSTPANRTTWLIPAAAFSTLWWPLVGSS